MACPSGPADEEPVLHAADVVLPIAEAPLPDGGVLVAAGHIVAVGPRASLEPRARSVRRWPGVLLPGLVNAHAHLQYTGFADLATSGLPFFPWIRALTARRREYDAAAWLGDARRGMDLAMRSGTTCVADVVSDLGALGAWDASDLTGIAYLEVVGADTTRWTGGGRARLLDALAAAPTGVPVGVSPHALYTLGTAVLTDCVRIAREHGARLHTHLAETAAESEYVLAAGGPFAAA
ncbi:MAG TPA: amidohydrolase family protein, partial [Mycobacteriales bacterium]|nr:amidohydrolase family protein [Mycobacteriales bacterium]